jgi:hypothetical protein
MNILSRVRNALAGQPVPRAAKGGAPVSVIAEVVENYCKRCPVGTFAGAV